MNEFLHRWIGKVFWASLAIAGLVDLLDRFGRPAPRYYDEFAIEPDFDPMARAGGNWENGFPWFVIVLLSWGVLAFIAVKVEAWIEKREEAEREEISRVAHEMDNDPEWQEHVRLIRAASDPRLLEKFDPSRP